MGDEERAPDRILARRTLRPGCVMADRWGQVGGQVRKKAAGALADCEGASECRLYAESSQEGVEAR